MRNEPDKADVCSRILWAAENVVGGVFCGKCAKYFKHSVQFDEHICSGKADPLDLIEMGRIEARNERETARDIERYKLYASISDKRRWLF